MYDSREHPGNDTDFHDLVNLDSLDLGTVHFISLSLSKRMVDEYNAEQEIEHGHNGRIRAGQEPR